MELTIKLSADGKVTVSGPIHEKLVCYGLLEAAKDAIREFGAQSSSIVPATQMPKEQS